MPCGVTCQIKSGCRMYLSLQQHSRKIVFVRSKKILLCREFNTFIREPKSMFLVRFSQQIIRNRVILKEQWRLDTFLRQKFIIPFDYSLCNNFCNKPKTEECENKKKLENKLSLYQKLKKMYKEYWYVLVPVHLITSTFWFGSFYYLAASGIDIPALLETLGAPESWINNLKNSKAGNIVLAYTLYKVATPLRYTVTIGGTTISINYLKKRGYIKPVPNKEQIKRMYEEQKGALQDLKASYQDKMQVTKNEFLKTKNEMKQHYIEAKEEFHKSVKDTRDDIRENVRGGADEWRLIGRLCAKSVKEGWQYFTDKKKSNY